jgi:CHRD domain
MNATLQSSRRVSAPIAALALSLFVGLALAADLKLSGANEVPPVTTTASGSGTITVAGDGSVSGSVKTTGIVATAAHIHVGAAGKNGPVIVPLAKGADGEWSVPPGAKLSAEQMTSYKAGELYVNVHSEANKGGEIRAQLAP